MKTCGARDQTVDRDWGLSQQTLKKHRRVSTVGLATLDHGCVHTNWFDDVPGVFSGHDSIGAQRLPFWSILPIIVILNCCIAGGVWSAVDRSAADLDILKLIAGEKSVRLWGEP